MTGEGTSEPSSDPTIMSAGAPGGVQASSINPADTATSGARTKTILEQQIAELRAREGAEQTEAARLARDRYWQGRISQYAPRPAPSLEFLVTPTMESREGVGGIDMGANVIGAGVAGVTDWLNIESQRLTSSAQERLQTMAAVNAVRSQQLYDMRVEFAAAVGEGATPEEAGAAAGSPESMAYLATEWSQQYAADLERARQEATTGQALQVARQFNVPVETAFKTVEMHPEIQPYEYRYGPGAQGRASGAPRPELTSGLDLYLKSISPEGKPAEFDPRLAAMKGGKRAADYLKVMRGEIAAHPGLYPEAYTAAALEYGQEAGGFESSIFRWAEAPHKINYWTGRLQETAPEMPVALAGIITGEKFKTSTPTPAAESMFTWAKEGGKDLLPASFTAFTREVAGEEPGQTPLGSLGTWGISHTGNIIEEKSKASAPPDIPPDTSSDAWAGFKDWLGGSTEIPTNPRWYVEQVTHRTVEYQKGLYELRTDTSPEATAQKMIMMAGLGLGVAAAYEGAGAVGSILGISSESPGLTGYAVTAAKYVPPLVMTGLLATRVVTSEKPLKELTGIVGTELIPMGVGAGIWEGLPVKPGVEVSEFSTGARSTQYGIRTVKGAQGITPLSVAEVETFNFKDYYSSAGKLLQRPEPLMEMFTGVLSRTTGTETAPGWQFGTPRLTWAQVAGQEGLVNVKGTGPGTMNILKNLKPEDVAKWDLGLSIREQTMGAGVPPGKMGPVFEEIAASHGIPNPPGVSRAMVDVLKADITMGEEGYLYGSPVQRAAGPTVGEIGVGRVPRDVDAMSPQAEVFQAKMVRAINRAAGTPAVRVEGEGIASAKGKLFDIHAMQAEMVGGVSPPVSEEYIGLGLRPGARVTTEEGVRTITMGEQSSRMLVRSSYTLSKEPRIMEDLVGQILPEHAGSIKGIGDFYFVSQANIKGLELQGKSTAGVRVDLETWLDLWGESRAAAVRTGYQARLEGGEALLPPVQAPPRYTREAPSMAIFGAGAGPSMVADLFGPSPRIHLGEDLISPPVAGSLVSMDLLTIPSPSVALGSPGSRSLIPRRPSPSLSRLLGVPSSPSPSVPSRGRSPPGYPPYSPILGSPSPAPSPLSPVYSPPGSPPRYSPPYSPPPYKSPPYSPPYSPPIPPRTPPGPPPPAGIFFGREDRGERPAREEYINFMQELAPTASFEEAFTAFKPPPRAPLPLVSKRWSIREGELGLLPPKQPARLVGMMRAQRIEQPSGLLFEGTGKAVPRVKNAPFFPGLIGPHPGVKGKRRKNKPFEGLL